MWRRTSSARCCRMRRMRGSTARNEGGVRNSVQPAFLCVPTAAFAGGDRCGPTGGYREYPAHARGAQRMSFPKYERYKDSGLEWLGKVPEYWEPQRLRFAAKINPSRAEVGDLPSDTAVSFFPMEAI